MDNIFENTYHQLSSNFYSNSTPASFSAPKLIAFNKELALELGMENIVLLEEKRLAKIFTGQEILPGGAYISQAYSGHQFGHFNPQLGDGRAIMMGETKARPKKDIQLKGSGPTAFSRRGDGFSELGPVLREYLVSEYMHRANIPTTRALAACTTGDPVYRQMVAPGGVFTRVASSHIRIGTFEYFASRNLIEELRTLLAYTIKRHYPELLDGNPKTQILDFLKAVSVNQSHMISKWMQVGFIHGVMNTDNMSICGETLDFGPCAFMDHFQNDKVFSFIDRHGRYRYNNQIQIGIWNLYQLANSLIPLMDSPSAVEQMELNLIEIQKFYHQEFQKKMLEKYGLKNVENFDQLHHSFLNILESNNLDFTNSYRLLLEDPKSLHKLTGSEQFFDLWPINSIDQEMMDRANPTIIPRNHLIEKAIKEAYEGDFTYFHKCLDIFSHTNSSTPSEFLSPPKPTEVITNTFCGT